MILAVKLLYDNCRTPELEKIIRAKLVKKYNPTHIQIIDESHLYEKHKNSQTHYKIYLKSEYFRDKSLFQVRIIL